MVVINKHTMNHASKNWTNQPQYLAFGDIGKRPKIRHNIKMTILIKKEKDIA